jgi:hypothetical protein
MPFYQSFLLIKCQYNYNNNNNNNNNKKKKKKPWIMPGIKMSSQHKTELYLLCRSTKDPKFKKNHYKTYSRILSYVIKTAKKLHYNNLIINSNNKSKTTWDIIKSEINNTKRNHNISSTNTDGKICNNYLDIAGAFNTYFATAHKISTNNSEIMHAVHPLNYLNQEFTRPFPSINLTLTSTK